MTTIFLAHPVADRDRALALASGLRSAGFTVLADPTPTGDNGWWAGLVAAVQDADVFLHATTPGGETSVVVAALRDYAAGIGIPALEIHLSGAGEASGTDFRRPTADAAFLVVGAIAARPGRPAVVGWRPQPESPFAPFADLARDVRAATLGPGDQRALVDRLRAAGGNPAVRELAAALRQRPDLDPESARRLEEAFPENAGAPSTGAGISEYAPDPAAGSGPGGAAAVRRPGGAAVWRPPAGALSADDMRSISFSKAPFGRRGYDEQEVDVFLDQVEKDLRARYAGGPVVNVQLIALDVHEVAFKKPPRGKRGYNEEEVDAFLDEIQRTITVLDHALAEHGSAVSKR